MISTSNISKDMKRNIFLVPTLMLIILMSITFVSATNVCKNVMGPTNTYYGVKFTPVSNTIDETATNTFFVSVENLDSYAKTITYQKYMCRCKEHGGDSRLSPNVCLDYWPYTRFAAGDWWLNSECKLVNETITLNPYEKKNVQISTPQYQNMKCGSFQLDLALVNVNGANVFNPITWSIADLCNDCEFVKCFDDSDCGIDGFVTSSTLVNVALNKPTTENTPNPGAPKDRIYGNNAVDGNVSTWWATGNLNPASLTVDLLSEYEINKYSITCGGINNGNQGTVHFFNGNGHEVATKNYICPGIGNSGKWANVVSDNFNPGIQVKTVRIDATSPTGGDWINIMEFELYSLIKTPSPDVFCQDDDVFQNFINYKCNAPGTSSSSCSSTIYPKLKQECSDNQTCSGGACVIDNTCGDTRIIQPATVSGIKFTTLYQTVNNNAINTLNISAENLDSFSKVIKYKKYSCTCREHLGNPLQSPGICSVFWPFDNTCHYVNETMTLGGNEIKYIQVSESQYQNMMCGSLQLDIGLLSVNGDNLPFQIVAASFADLCNDCAKVGVCDDDSDCDDNNSSTEDKCINPGTPESRCEHKVIHCSKNSDCGCDRFVGTAFCQSGNVFGDYITYICNNPGTCNSYCTDSTQAKLKTTCLGNETCSNGACVPKVIHCSNNSDCGTNGFVGDLFCKSGDVFGNYITYTCTNPGTCHSTCTNSTTEKLKTECSSDETCSDGKCEAESHGSSFEEQRYYDSIRNEDYLVNTNKDTAIAFIALNETNKSATILGIKSKKGFDFSLWWIILIIGILVLLLIILIILVIKSASDVRRKRK